MLRADGQADGVGAYALIQQFFRAQLGMGGGSRMDHQTLHVRHVGQQGEDFQIVDEGPGFLLTSLDFKGEDGCAALGKIPFIQRVVRMVRQGRMVHLFHQGMVFQVFHHFLRIFRVPVQPEGKGFHALQKQESVKGRNGRAGVPEKDGANVSDERGRAHHIIEGNAVIAWVGRGDIGIFPAGFPIKLPGFHDDTAQGGAVAAQELGGGMHHDVGPVLDGADQVRCAEGVVDHQGEAVLVGDCRDGVDIRDVAVGVAQGFQVNVPNACMVFLILLLLIHYLCIKK